MWATTFFLNPNHGTDYYIANYFAQLIFFRERENYAVVKDKFKNHD